MIQDILSSRTTRLALLGCGTVGSEVARRVAQHGERLGLSIVKVLVRDVERDRGLDPALLTNRFEDVLDAAPDVIIEVLGGLEPARSCVDRLLQEGIPVVSANKTLLAHHGAALAETAAQSGASLAYEAAVCAGVPILAGLRQLAGDRVSAVRGIVNGSCNYILSRMEESGLSLTEALEEAGRRGLVEPDPSADISGRDSAEKLCVLARAAGLGDLTPSQVECAGIESITPADVRSASRASRVIRLVAELEQGPEGLRARVGPALLPRTHPLASVRREENGVFVEAELAGELFFRGPGAGPRPTASALLGDVLRITARSPVPAAAGHARSVEPRRRHAIRITSPTPLFPNGVLETVRRTGLEAEEVDLSPHSVLVVARPSPRDAAVACAAALPGTSLVLPLLE